MNDSLVPSSPTVNFSRILLCEDCGVDFNCDRDSVDELKNWAMEYERIGDPPHFYCVPRGSICDICMAKRKAAKQ